MCEAILTAICSLVGTIIGAKASMCTTKQILDNEFKKMKFQRMQDDAEKIVTLICEFIKELNIHATKAVAFDNGEAFSQTDLVNFSSEVMFRRDYINSLLQIKFRNINFNTGKINRITTEIEQYSELYPKKYSLEEKMEVCKKLSENLQSLSNEYNNLQKEITAAMDKIEKDISY